MKTNINKTILKSTFTALSLAIIVSIVSGCANPRGSSGGGMHNMGNLKNPAPMADRNMPDR